MDSAIIRGFRINGIDVLTTREAGNLGATDRAQLEFAGRESRVLYTANVADFRRLHNESLLSGGHHFGIILRSRQRSPASVQLNVLLRISAAHDGDQLVDQLVWTSDWS